MNILLKNASPVSDPFSTSHELEDYLETLEKTRPIIPSMYKVIMLNDDYTPMDFVVNVLKTVFHKSTDQSVAIMLTVHHQGSDICGIFTHEIAETKIQQVRKLSKRHHYPLQCIMEKQ